MFVARFFSFSYLEWFDLEWFVTHTLLLLCVGHSLSLPVRSVGCSCDLLPSCCWSAPSAGSWTRTREAFFFSFLELTCSYAAFYLFSCCLFRNQRSFLALAIFSRFCILWVCQKNKANPPPPCPSAVVFQGDVIYIPSWNPGSSQWVHSAVKKKNISAANVPGEVGQYERDEWREEDSKYLLYCSLPLLHDAARMEVKETKQRLSFLFHFPSSCHSCETISPASSLSLPLSLPFFESGWLNTEVIAVTN